MKQDRNPAISPITGDVLVGIGFQKTVRLVSTAGWVLYHNGSRKVWQSPHGWEKWARNAKVVKLASE